MSNAALAFIESQRGEGDVVAQLEIQYQWQDTRRTTNGPVVPGEVYWGIAIVPARFARSDWTKHLGEMEWSEIELFEIDKLPLSANDLTESVRLVREAETALRTADHPQVLAKCRSALESAAKYTGKTNDTSEAFTALLASVFPEEDAVRRDAMNQLIKGLSAYLHLGRHERYPTVHISRAEAQFVLTTTIGLFSLISERLATVAKL